MNSKTFLFRTLISLFSLSALLVQGCGKNKEKAAEDSITPVVTEDTITIDTPVDTVVAAVPVVPRDKYIIVDKTRLKLFLVNKGDTVFSAPICASRNKGQKRAKDDRRTPEGDFKITHIHDASNWLYHTDDGRWVPHVYGPWFLRLDAGGWQGIGIHGTNAPAQIGQRRSKGCIRMKNEDISKLHAMVEVGMRVVVLPDNGETGPAKPTINIQNPKNIAETKEAENPETPEQAAAETPATAPAEAPSVEPAPAPAPEPAPAPAVKPETPVTSPSEPA